jgi:hypothetical protein
VCLQGGMHYAMNTPFSAAVAVDLLTTEPKAIDVVASDRQPLELEDSCLSARNCIFNLVRSPESILTALFLLGS